MTKPVTVSALDGTLTVTASHERGEIHIERAYLGQVKHRFLRAHGGTQTELEDAARGDLTYIKEEILRAADKRIAQRYPRQSNRNIRPRRRTNPAARPRGSANSYILEVTTRAGHKFELVAYWAAPYFVYDESGEDAKGHEAEPFLYHAETLADARRVAKRGGKILNADFSEYKG